MNIGTILKWGSIFMGMVQDPNIHMMEEMGIQPRGNHLQRLQGMPRYGGVPVVPEYQRPNNPPLFPWMEQSSNAAGKKQQKRKSRKR